MLWSIEVDWLLDCWVVYGANAGRVDDGREDISTMLCLEWLEYVIFGQVCGMSLLLGICRCNCMYSII